MSRTIRKPKWLIRRSRVAYINKGLSYRPENRNDAEKQKIAALYDKMARDGFWNETGRNSGFKHCCKKEWRNKNKSDIHNVMYNKRDADDIVFAGRKNGKAHRWDFW